MYKKLFAAPLVLALALSSVAPTMASAAEELEQTTVTTSNDALQSKEVNYDLLLKNAVTNKFDQFFSLKDDLKIASVQVVDGKYEVTMDITSILSKFEVDGVEATDVTNEQTPEGFKTIKFAINHSLHQNAQLTLGYTMGAFHGEHAMELDFTPGYTPIQPLISFAGYATASYDQQFQNIAYKDVNGQKQVVMNVFNGTTSFKVNGEEVPVQEDELHNKYVEFMVNSFDQDLDIEYGYAVMGHAASHHFNFDFTPSYEEMVADLQQFEFAKETTFTTPQDYSAVVKSIGYYDAAVKLLKQKYPNESATFEDVEAYKDAKQALDSYKAPFLTAVKEKLAALTFTTENTIHTEAQLTEAKAQLEAMQQAVATATAAGLTAKNDFETLENYANMAAQQAVVNAGVKPLSTKRTLKATITNKVGKVDTVKVTGVKKGDTVRLYDAKGKKLAQATAKSTSYTFTKLNLGKAKGSVQVTAQAKNEKESKKVTIKFAAEPVSKALKASYVSVKNNKVKADVVTIKGTAKGEIIYVYNAKGKQLKKVTASGKTTTVKIAQLGKKATTIQLARVQKNKLMSSKTVVKVSKEK